MDDLQNENSGYAPELWEKIVSACVSVGIVVLIGWILVRNKKFADPNLVIALRVLLSLSAAILGATIPGFLNVKWNFGGALIRAGGALALFVLTLFGSPKVIKSRDGREQTLPPAAVEAVNGWTKGTTIIIETLREQARKYPDKLSEKAGIPKDLFGHLTVDQENKLSKVRNLAFDDFEEEGHQRFLAANADPRVVNPVLRQYFPDVQVMLRDGSVVTMDKAISSGREMHEHFFELVFKATIRGDEPLSDDAVRSQLSAYLERRQSVTEAIERYLADPNR